jgi:predicted PhzF superfamily epimerase YddE/YHI9
MIRITTVDAFTEKPFGGNPAAVVVRAPHERALTEDEIRLIAREMNLSETAFCHRKTVAESESGKLLEDASTGAPVFSLRWLTPETEVDLCGHATLATAHTLFTEPSADGGDSPWLDSSLSAVAFDTRSGRLVVRRGIGAGGRLQMDFPRGAPKSVLVALRGREGVLEAIVEHVMGADLPEDVPALFEDICYCPRTKKLIVHVREAKLATGCKANSAGMMAIDFGVNVRGVCVTANTAGEDSGPYAEYDFVSRYFAPWVGIPEDPVTGSLHTVLGVYFGEVLGKRDLIGLQASSRAGVVHVHLPDDPERILLAGNAVTMMRGNLTI